MRAIFISYRREDAEGQAGRLFDDLSRRFGEHSVFMDVAGIEPGRDFRRVIDEHVGSCGVLLAVIGKSWIDAKDDSGRRRLEDPMDFVRLETASALKRDIPVVPVLVHGARMPRAEQLPEDMSELAYRNGVEVTHARWDSDVQLLIKSLSPHVETAQKSGRTNNVLKHETPNSGKACDSPPTDGAGNVALSGASAVKKSLATLVAATAAVLIIAVTGHLWYQVSSEHAQMTRQRELLEEMKNKITAEELGAKKRAEEKALAEALEVKRQAAERALAAETDAKKRAQERALAQDMEAKRQAQERAYAQDLEAKKRAEEIAEADKRRAQKQAEEAAIAEKRDADRRARERAAAEEREKIRLAQEKAAAARRARWPSYNFPPPNGGLLVYTIMPDGNPACASYDGGGCLWGLNYDQIDFRRLQPLVCGEEHRARWGVTGYENLKHWCNLARRLRAARR
jgi:hypothetical protein